MINQHRRFEEVLQDALKNPAFRQEWEASETRYRVIERRLAECLKRGLNQCLDCQLMGSSLKRCFSNLFTR